MTTQHPHLFPQKHRNTTAEVICKAPFSLNDQRHYLLGAAAGARTTNNTELDDLFMFYHNRLYNLSFMRSVPLRNLTDNTPATEGS